MNEAIKILMLEDDPFLGEIYARKLKNIGTEVELVDDADIFLKKAKEENFSLFLIDIVIPKMDGFEVLKVLKDEGKTKNLPVVVLTNLDQEENVKKALSMGAVDYIIKSRFTPAETIERIEKIIKNAKG